jgi:hypothetical protein
MAEQQKPLLESGAESSEGSYVLVPDEQSRPEALEEGWSEEQWYKEVDAREAAEPEPTDSEGFGAPTGAFDWGDDFGIEQEIPMLQPFFHLGFRV